MKQLYAKGMCKQCYNKRYRELHPEKIRLLTKQNHESRSDYGGSKTNKECTLYLGCTVAERVLSHVFKNVERMSTNNPGYDFICGKGYMVDVKSSCRITRREHSDSWRFTINYNITADYFLCIAFDDRELLNPEHLWLIPGSDINNKHDVTMTGSKLHKWNK